MDKRENLITAVIATAVLVWIVFGTVALLRPRMTPISCSTCLTSVATTTDACSDILTKPLKYGDQNADVAKLQTFLIGVDGEEIPAGITGYFGAQTKTAVNAFQLKYSFQILYPLKLAAPTGAVYNATIAQINAVYCSSIGF